MTFLENKYTKIYYQLIEKRKNNLVEGYAERHHIIPKSLGGSNSEENIIILTAREHFIAHLLLTKMTVGQDNIKMNWALHKMIFSSVVDRFNGREYEWYRKRHVKFLKENHPSKNRSWRERVSEVVTANWQENGVRRAATSKRMKQTWEEKRPILEKHCKKISKKGAQASKQVVAKRLEYNGKIYLGYNELLEQTGVSKFLYHKFYERGIDPSFRVGRNGPMTKDDFKRLVELFTEKEKTFREFDQLTEKELEDIIQRMYNIGLLTEKEKNMYSNYNRKENL